MGGVGDCEPATWTPWAKRWWKDSWCLQGGAHLALEYKPDGTLSVKPSLEAE